MKRPLGYWYRTLTASYEIEKENKQEREISAGRILVSEDETFSSIIYDTGKSRSVRGMAVRLDVPLKPCTRYYWKVQVWQYESSMVQSDTEWFETGLMDRGFQGIPIAPSFPSDSPVVFEQSFTAKRLPERARLYICCLGVYEVRINGVRVGDEVLAPGLTVYDRYVQYQTYDTGAYIREGENRIEVEAADGWYKGKYGYRQNEAYANGKQYELLADLYFDGECVLRTDCTWKVRRSTVRSSDIYDGEVCDPGFDVGSQASVVPGSLEAGVVKERLGVPVRVKERLQAKRIIRTPAGENVLDMGQNMAGRVRFFCREPKGTRVVLEHGEVLQNGCFYNRNYRTAKAEYIYISDGIPRWIYAKFCFFGFRYVRITGITEPDPADFFGEVIYSDLEPLSRIHTGHSLLNRLMENILWSQKSNFIDIPTDCPQRDEKMGWTGDAQIFAETACMNMECYPFFRKYLHDIALEQQKNGGKVPQIVPSVGRSELTSAAWGDAAVIIPWTLYRIYGDPSILEEQYESMKAWIGYIDSQNRENGTDPCLWQNGFHYGDWLALDGGYYHMPTGGTDVYYVSSVYFYHSVKLLAKTAEVLGRETDFRIYSEKAEQIRQAVRREYFAGSGKVAVNTQTACILALVFGIARGEEREPVKQQFLEKIRRDGYHLKTGFAGTPFLLEALSECGRNDLALRILLDEEYPGWLYPVTLGATTMWERWDSLNPDGKMSDTGMNSLNHYANGSVGAWIYCRLAGLRQQPGSAGFSRTVIEPLVSPKLGGLDFELHTASGWYKIVWETKRRGEKEYVKLSVTIPPGAETEIRLPCVAEDMEPVLENGKMISGIVLMRGAGEYIYEYRLSPSWRTYYSMEDSVRELVRNPEIRDYLYRKVPMLEKVDGAEIQNMTLEQMSRLPFFLGIGTHLGLEKPVLEEIRTFISKIEKR